MSAPFAPFYTLPSSSYDGGTRTADGSDFFSQLLLSNTNGDFHLAMEEIHDTAATGPFAWFLRQRTTGGTVADGDSVGKLGYYGHDGTDYSLSASLNVVVDGTPAANQVPSHLSVIVTSTKFGGGVESSERARFGGAPIVVSGVSVERNFSVVEESAVGAEAAFMRYLTGTTGANFGLYKARGSEASPVIVSAADTIGQVAAFGHDGTDFEQLANLQFKVDPTNTDAGSFEIQTKPTGGSLTQRLLVDSEGRISVNGAETTLTVNGTTFDVRVNIHSESDLVDLSVHRHHATAGIGGAINFNRSRGSESSETAVSSGDTIGILSFTAHNGTDYGIAATIDALVGSGTISGTSMPGRLRFRTTPDASESPSTRMMVLQSGVVDVSGSDTPTSYNLLAGAGDLGCAGDFEVNGESRFNDVIGCGIAPDTDTIIKGYASSSTLVIGIDMELAPTFSGAPPTSGANVLVFTLTDTTTTSGTPYTLSGALMTILYDRSAHTSQTMYGVNVDQIGIKSGRSLASGSYTWRGYRVSVNNPDTITRVSGTGTFAMAAFSSDGFDWANWLGPATVPTVTYYGAKLDGGIYIAEEKKRKGQTVADEYCCTIFLDPSFSKISGFPTYAITRYNYMDLQNPTVGSGAAITDACIMRFDAAAGTHYAVDSGTTKGSPGTVNAWLKYNINGTVYYVGAYTSKTS